MPARAAQPAAPGPPLYQSEKRERGRRRPPRAERARRRAPSSRAARTRPSAASATSAGAAEAEERHPADARVAAGAERVDERDRPRGVREPVHRAPPLSPIRARSRLVSVSASRRSKATVPSPSQIGPVRREEREDRVLEPDRREAVGDRRDDVRGDERDREQRQVPVQALDEEARQRLACASGEPATPSRTTRGEQEQGDDAGAAGRVPEGARRRRPRASSRRAGSMQPPRASRRRRRARRRRGASRGGQAAAARARPAPRRRARPTRCPATFASTQVAAATVTVRHGVTAGRPVRGIDEVVELGAAGAPAAHGGAGAGERRRRRARPSGPGDVERRGVVVGDPDRPAAGRLRRRRRRRRRRARRARRSRRRLVGGGGAAVGRERLRGRAEVELGSGRHADGRALLVQLDDLPAGDAVEAQRRSRPVAGGDEAERAVVAGEAQRAADRRVDEPVRRGARRRARRGAPRAAAARRGRAGRPARFTAASSLSSRKRLHAQVDGMELPLERAPARPAAPRARRRRRRPSSRAPGTTRPRSRASGDDDRRAGVGAGARAQAQESAQAPERA